MRDTDLITIAHLKIEPRKQECKRSDVTEGEKRDGVQV